MNIFHFAKTSTHSPLTPRPFSLSDSNDFYLQSECQATDEDLETLSASQRSRTWAGVVQSYCVDLPAASPALNTRANPFAQLVGEGQGRHNRETHSASQGH